MSTCQILAVDVADYKLFYGITSSTDDAKIELYLETVQEYLQSYLGTSLLYGTKCITSNRPPIIDDVNVDFNDYGTTTYYKINGILQAQPTIIGGVLVDCNKCINSGCSDICDVYEVCYNAGYMCIPACIRTAIYQMTYDLMGGSVSTSAGGLTGWTDKVGDLSHSETYDLGAVSQAVFGKLPNAVVECLKRLRKIKVYAI